MKVRPGKFTTASAHSFMLSTKWVERFTASKKRKKNGRGDMAKFLVHRPTADGDPHQALVGKLARHYAEVELLLSF